jgi:hypothetical protein
LLKSLSLRAEKVNAQSISVDGSSAPEIKKEKAVPKRRKPAAQSSGTVINIHGNVTGSNIVLGNDNKVENTSDD